MNVLWQPSFPWPHFLIRGAVVFISVVLLIRIAGKRQIGQMGTGEFVAILLISNAVQNAMNGGDNSITGGLILALVITVLSMTMAYAAFKSKRWEALLQGRPTLLIHRGAVVESNLKKEWLSGPDLRAMLRRQGIERVEDVEEAVLESDGQVSVVKKSDTPARNI